MMTAFAYRVLLGLSLVGCTVQPTAIDPTVVGPATPTAGRPSPTPGSASASDEPTLPPAGSAGDRLSVVPIAHGERIESLGWSATGDWIAYVVWPDAVTVSDARDWAHANLMAYSPQTGQSCRVHLPAGADLVEVVWHGWISAHQVQLITNRGEALQWSLCQAALEAVDFDEAVPGGLLSPDGDQIARLLPSSEDVEAWAIEFRRQDGATLATFPVELDSPDQAARRIMTADVGQWLNDDAFLVRHSAEGPWVLWPESQRQTDLEDLSGGQISAADQTAWSAIGSSGTHRPFVWAALRSDQRQVLFIRQGAPPSAVTVADGVVGLHAVTALALVSDRVNLAGYEGQRLSLLDPFGGTPARQVAQGVLTAALAPTGQSIALSQAERPDQPRQVRVVDTQTLAAQSVPDLDPGLTWAPDGWSPTGALFSILGIGSGGSPSQLMLVQLGP